jgi:hypothetical protein
VLNDHGVTDRLHIDPHRAAVIRRGNSGRDMRVRAALILAVWQIEQPAGDVYLVCLSMDDGPYHRVSKLTIAHNPFRTDQKLTYLSPRKEYS